MAQITANIETLRKEIEQSVKDISSHSVKDLTPTSIISHVIELTDNIPFAQKPRPIPYNKKDEFKKLIDDMVEANVIVPSNSPYSSPIHLVKKCDGTIRMTIDYRKLNSLTIKDNYPLPRIEVILNKLSKARIYSKLDFASGYYQVCMSKGSRKFTAFTCEFGHFEFTVLSMGLKNAGATFQRLMDNILSKYIGQFVMVYLDDIIIFSTSIEEHNQHLEQVFQVIREH